MDFINNSNVPKLINYLIVIILCSFIIFISVSLAIESSPMLVKIFGVILVVVFLVALIYFKT